MGSAATGSTGTVPQVTAVPVQESSGAKTILCSHEKEEEEDTNQAGPRIQATPWNYSILALAAVVVVISSILLGRSIQANRNRKMKPPEKEIPEVLHLDEAGTKDSSLDNLKETLLSEKPNLAQVETEPKERDVPPVLLPDPPAAESQ